jgi:feruloyl esterase
MNSRSLFLSAVSLAALAASGGFAQAATCESLTGLSLPNTTISLSQSYTAGEVITGSTKAPVALCRVVGKITPSSDSDINFEVWMPSSNWTGRYVQVGNGGFGGSIVYSAMLPAIENGNATASTDDGSSQPVGEPGGFFALGHPDRILDLFYRAVHLTNIDAKALVSAFYDEAPAYSYFNGCSKGGGESLAEVQRFPDDFDGILGGDAVNDGTPLLDGFVWDTQAIGVTEAGPAAGFLPTSNIPALSAAELSQCAKAKLVSTDLFLDDPRQCNVNLEALLCTGSANSSCLTQAQIKGVKAVLSGPITTFGLPIAPGYEPEFSVWPELGSLTQAPGTPPNATLQGFFALGIFTYFLNPPLTLSSFNVDTTPAYLALKLGAALNFTNPDLRPFRQNGGKLIQYHGWADPLVAPKFSTEYFDSVVQFDRYHGDFFDAVQNTQSFFRLFMAPGMGHCGGGPGPNEFGTTASVGLPTADPASDMFAALETWVEKGIAPPQIIASGTNTGVSPPVPFTRPLCSYPQHAVYVSGDTNDASSFVCGD